MSQDTTQMLKRLVERDKLRLGMTEDGKVVVGESTTGEDGVVHLKQNTVKDISNDFYAFFDVVMKARMLQAMTNARKEAENQPKIIRPDTGTIMEVNQSGKAEKD